MNVSTHAPLWGTTVSHDAIADIVPVSTHVPLRDAMPSFKQRNVCTVSTHVPVWGTTQGPNENISLQGVSTHAPVWGTTVTLLSLFLLPAFQLTCPYGARPWETRRISSACSCFNSRARVGRDARMLAHVCLRLWFQLTRPRRARP